MEKRNPPRQQQGLQSRAGESGEEAVVGGGGNGADNDSQQVTPTRETGTTSRIQEEEVIEVEPVLDITVKVLHQHCVEDAKRFFTIPALKKAKIAKYNDIGKMKTTDGRRLNEAFFVIGVLYRITHVKHDAAEIKESYSNKKPKRDYNRMLFFGTPCGDTFSVILQNTQASNSALRYCRNNKICVGRPFALYEPKKREGNGVKQDQRTLILTAPLIPLSLTFVKYLPTVTPPRPMEGEELFFVMRSRQLDEIKLPRISGAKLKSKYTMDKACCNGYLCDRQTVFQTNQHCGCLQVDRNVSGIVMEYDVEFCDDAENEEEKFQFVQGQRSLRTTQIFVSSLEDGNMSTNTSEMERDLSLRESVDDMVQFVEDNGGFTMMGYKSVGGVNSGIDGAPKNDSEMVTYHVVYLYPTKTSLPYSAEMKSRMFTCGS